jgi:hypothetical protein
MFQRLSMQLPAWARSNHPHLRYELGSARPSTRRSRYFRGAIAVIATILLFWFGVAIATNFFQNPPGQNLTESMMAVVYWPTLALQVVMQMAVLALTVNLVTEQKRRLAWDNLRATEGGVALALRTRWATIYYRLRLILAAVLVIRAGLIFGILYDLTAFQGRYIDLLLNDVTPRVPPLVGALLLAFLMTAALLLPITSLGLIAAIGLLISVNVQQRVYSVMTQVIVSAGAALIVGGLIIGATQFIRGELAGVIQSDVAAWGLMGAFAAVGDWGLSFLHLGFYSEVWATIPYALLFGIALLGFALLQSVLTEWILALAVRRAERMG